MKLRLQDVPELADLPWELLLDTHLDRFLAQSNRTPIVRYVEMTEKIRPLTVSLPLKLLVMIANPAGVGYTRLDVAREQSILAEALRLLIEQQKLSVRWLEQPTLASLQRCLRKDSYHVFHFVGHGGFDKRTEEGVLLLEDEQKRGWEVGAHRIGTLLRDHRTLRLAVLNSCEGARNSRSDPFAGVATSMVRQGVPAVVAMQFEITDEAAITFSEEFYSALAEGFPVDAALAEARKAIYFRPNDIEWGTPVLYLRSPDGVLFDIHETVVDGTKKEARDVELKTIIHRTQRKPRKKVTNEETKRKVQEQESREEPEQKDLAQEGFEQSEEQYKKGNTFYNEGDFAQAVKWYRKAADQGHADAQANLGWMYDPGSRGSPERRGSGQVVSQGRRPGPCCWAGQPRRDVSRRPRRILRMMRKLSPGTARMRSREIITTHEYPRMLTQS